MAATTAAKRKLSGSTNGKGIKIVPTTTPGTTIHDATATTDGTDRDELYVYLYNGHTADVTVTFEVGGVTDPDNLIIVTIPFKSGLVLALPGLPFDNAVNIDAFASVANVVMAYGWINAITQDAD